MMAGRAILHKLRQEKFERDIDLVRLNFEL
jgi:hypothetical protein